MARLGDQILARGEDHLVTRDADGRVAVLAWALEPRPLRLSIPLAGSSAFVMRSSVNEEAGNAWAAWRELGSPPSPRPRQLDALREAAEPVRSHRRLPITAGRVAADLTLARHEVTLLELTPVVDETPVWWDDDRVVGHG
jgi:xylan 1,4-beta-xylosidase